MKKWRRKMPKIKFEKILVLLCIITTITIISVSISVVKPYLYSFSVISIRISSGCGTSGFGLLLLFWFMLCCYLFRGLLYILLFLIQNPLIWQKYCDKRLYLIVVVRTVTNILFSAFRFSR